MYLQQLIDGTGSLRWRGTPDESFMIAGITQDSREVRKGFLFAALTGTKADGRKFIQTAIDNGATAVLAETGTPVPDHVVLIESENPRRDFALLAARFFGRQIPVTVAVTGTNGKTSTVNFCRQIWQTMDHAAASLGTIGIIAPGITRAGSLTTPDPVVLHSEIAELEAAGVTHLAMEASSMGLYHYRMDGVKLTAAGFINLTRDHLDDHGTMDDYTQAKLRLFRDILPADGVAALWVDDPAAQKFIDVCNARGIRTITIGRNGTDIRLENLRAEPHGQHIDITVFGERYRLQLPLIGAFQVENALLALGLVIAADPDNRMLQMQAVQALEKLPPVRGRLEFAGQTPNGAAVYVDYAHTPDGIEKVLTSLRPHTVGELHIVFGCGGDRDAGKRPMMGAIAARLADHVIVTDDNPRTENADAIRAAIMAAAPHADNIGGRGIAIRKAIASLQSGDVLVIAGKGHEQGQIVGTEILPFDDVTAARKAIEDLKNDQKTGS